MSNNRTTELRRCKYCGEKPQVLKMDGRAAHACRVLDRELRMTVDEWNVENEDATEKLRRMLDERGIEYTDDKPRKFGVTVEQMAKASADYFDKLPSINGKKADSLQDSRENLGSNLGSGSEVAFRVDSREKLETDAIAYCDHFRCTHQRFNETKLIALLDRQAAITERHWMEICGANASANIELNRQNDELRLKVRRQGKQLAELQAERDMYRDKLVRALDAAHEVVRMMEVELPRGEGESE